MRDKIELLMAETGCDQGEAELALEMCGYDLEGAVQAIPRLFQNIAVLKSRLWVRHESLYGLWLAILSLKDRSVLRARAVISYNPAVYSSELDKPWFDFETRLYACRLWAGSLQSLSQEVERLLGAYFGSPEAAFFYEGRNRFPDRDFASLRALLVQQLGDLKMQVSPEILDMGQFRELRPAAEGRLLSLKSPRRPAAQPGPLVLRIALEPSPDGVAADELHAGDGVYATITDSRDIGRYLAGLFGAGDGQGAPVLVPVEAIERQRGPGASSRTQVLVRVRFSAGLCGDVALPLDIRLKAERRVPRASWWRRMFGG